MARLRSAVVVTLIWVATVAGVSATAWVAIDRAGRDISGAPVSPLDPLSTSTTTAPTTPVTNPSTAHDTPGASASRPVTRGSTTASSPARRDQSISVTGGQVSVRCADAAILLRIAQPDNGWRVDVRTTGPQAVDLTFERSGEDVEGGSRVTAVCANGTAAFTVANRAPGNDE